MYIYLILFYLNKKEFDEYFINIFYIILFMIENVYYDNSFCVI